MNIELNPCPYCGKDPVFVGGTKGPNLQKGFKSNIPNDYYCEWWSFVSCGGCHMQTPWIKWWAEFEDGSPYSEIADTANDDTMYHEEARRRLGLARQSAADWWNIAKSPCGGT